MSRLIGTDVQDKDEAVARSINWAPDLDGATISTVTWFTDGLTSQSETATTTVASIRLAVPATVLPGTVCHVTCRITTSNGETLETHIDLTVDN